MPRHAANTTEPLERSSDPGINDCSRASGSIAVCQEIPTECGCTKNKPTPARAKHASVGGSRSACALIHAGWQPRPQILRNAPAPLHWALFALLYLAWTLILIGAFALDQTL
jgi:hypothetical protein